MRFTILLIAIALQACTTTSTKNFNQSNNYSDATARLKYNIDVIADLQDISYTDEKSKQEYYKYKVMMLSILRMRENSTLKTAESICRSDIAKHCPVNDKIACLSESRKELTKSCQEFINKEVNLITRVEAEFDGIKIPAGSIVEFYPNNKIKSIESLSEVNINGKVYPAKDKVSINKEGNPITSIKEASTANMAPYKKNPKTIILNANPIKNKKSIRMPSFATKQ